MMAAGKAPASPSVSSGGATSAQAPLTTIIRKPDTALNLARVHIVVSVLAVMSTPYYHRIAPFALLG
jgi:hypothetical protein